MTLQDYLQSLPRGGRQEMADFLEVKLAYLNNVAGGKQPSIELAIKIHHHTKVMIGANILLSATCNQKHT